MAKLAATTRATGSSAVQASSGPHTAMTRFCQQFKWSVIAPIEADRWAVDAGDGLNWLESAAAGTAGVVRLAVGK